jgi:hypothetical protein
MDRTRTTSLLPRSGHLGHCIDNSAQISAWRARELRAAVEREKWCSSCSSFVLFGSCCSREARTRLPLTQLTEQRVQGWCGVESPLASPVGSCVKCRVVMCRSRGREIVDGEILCEIGPCVAWTVRGPHPCFHGRGISDILPRSRREQTEAVERERTQRDDVAWIA